MASWLRHASLRHMRAAILMAVMLSACGQQSAVLTANDEASTAAPSRWSPKPASLRRRSPSRSRRESSLLQFLLRLVGGGGRRSGARRAVHQGHGEGEIRADRGREGRSRRAAQAKVRLSYPRGAAILWDCRAVGPAVEPGEQHLRVHGWSAWLQRSGSLLWDRKLAREVPIQDLLQPGTSWTGAIRSLLRPPRPRTARNGVASR